MFDWDPKKAKINQVKHRISFGEAATIFADDRALDWQDLAHSSTEPRFKRLGQSVFGKILLAIYTVRRSKDGEETIRIISARPASRKERRAYQG